MLEASLGYILYDDFGPPYKGLHMKTSVETLQAKMPILTG